MLLKVPLNWQTDNMSCVEAGLNEEIGCPREVRSSTFIPPPHSQPLATPLNPAKKKKKEVVLYSHNLVYDAYKCVFCCGFCIVSRATTCGGLGSVPLPYLNCCPESKENNSSFHFLSPHPTPTFLLFLRTHKQRQRQQTAEPRICEGQG